MFKKAFTLIELLIVIVIIELLIVIVIIGILATALIPRFTGAQNKARYARVEKDFRDFRTAVFLAQTNTNKPLKDITNRGATMSPCYGMTGDLRLLANNHDCRLSRISALRKIENAAGMSSGMLAGLETDPRGSPYILNENEGEIHQATPCDYKDNLFTVGPDGLFGVMNWTNGDDVRGDNRGMNIAPMGCPGAY